MQYLGYTYSRSALGKIIDKWYENKYPLIQLLSKHPNYVKGKYYIQFDHDFDRDIKVDDLNILMEKWYVGADVDTRLQLHLLKNEIYQKKLDEEENVFMPNSMVEFLRFLKEYKNVAVTEEFIDAYNRHLGSYGMTIKIAEGMKTSRAVNRICSALGIDKIGSYNKVFAVYSDALSPLKIKRHTVISCHPLDYLLMSNGNSWTSCHTINKFSKDGENYGGCHASGTISYMLDGTSMVYYEVSADYNGKEIELQPKIIRQMYHYADHALVQGRLYPQSNDDGFEHLYTDKRNIVQKILADTLDVPNRWIVKKGTNACCKVIDHADGSTHYTDTSCFSTCNVSYLRGEEDNDKYMLVGHRPICIECGCYHDNAEQINCCDDPDRDAYLENTKKMPRKGAII